MANVTEAQAQQFAELLRDAGAEVPAGSTLVVKSEEDQVTLQV